MYSGICKLIDLWGIAEQCLFPGAAGRTASAPAMVWRNSKSI